MQKENTVQEALEALDAVKKALKRAYEDGYNEGKKRTHEMDKAYDYLRKTIISHAVPSKSLVEALDTLYLRRFD